MKVWLTEMTSSPGRRQRPAGRDAAPWCSWRQRRRASAPVIAAKSSSKRETRGPLRQPAGTHDLGGGEGFLLADQGLVMGIMRRLPASAVSSATRRPARAEAVLETDCGARSRGRARAALRDIGQARRHGVDRPRLLMLRRELRLAHHPPQRVGELEQAGLRAAGDV